MQMSRVVVSLDHAAVKDSDLVLFESFSFVQILSLGNAKIADGALGYLLNLPKLETLIGLGSACSKSHQRF
ncbi:hypothetical protein MNBD_GAMMA12-3949 [hydrothermal vent metagenome]|uniref:Uncharacterized protein n=1 Tax=hydrothermal vent metagenome TaxID=652676 RepID=A0A3B0ZIH0_9ZZZZ